MIGFNTQPPEGGWRLPLKTGFYLLSFNTQPPEGGWYLKPRPLLMLKGFNTQPPEGGWPSFIIKTTFADVSTHSRPKAAGRLPLAVILDIAVSTHSRPKAAGQRWQTSCLPF